MSDTPFSALRALRQRRRDAQAWADAYTITVCVYGLLRARHVRKARAAEERIDDAVDARLALLAASTRRVEQLVEDLGKAFLAGHTTTGAHRGDHAPYPEPPPVLGGTWKPDHTAQARCSWCPVSPDVDCRLMCTEVPAGEARS